MKMGSLILLVCLLVVGCDSTPSSIEYNTTMFEHRGHNYLIFAKSGFRGRHSNPIIHDPDCPCYQKDK